jgi:hypothetical protein
MSADVCDSLFATLNYINDTIGYTRLLQEVQEDLHSSWYLLRGLHNVGVSKSDSKWEHPKRAHGREVERSNTCADTERDSVAVKVNTLGNVFKGLTLSKRSEAASMLNDFITSENITLGINERFTVLLGNNFNDFVLINKNMRIYVLSIVISN